MVPYFTDVMSNTDIGDDQVQIISPPKKNRRKKPYFNGKVLYVIVNTYKSELRNIPNVLISEIIGKVVHTTGTCNGSVTIITYMVITLWSHLCSS